MLSLKWVSMMTHGVEQNAHGPYIYIYRKFKHVQVMYSLQVFKPAIPDSVVYIMVSLPKQSCLSIISGERYFGSV